MTDPTLNDDLEALPGLARTAVAASLGWRAGRPAPDVTLEFCGVDRPIELLGALASLGWAVPVIPSPPSTAIEWIPDPVAGTDHTIRPWRVKEFKLVPGEWERETASLIAVHTLGVLQRFHAVVDVPEDLLRDLRGESPRDAPTPAAPAQKAEAPKVIVIGSTNQPAAFRSCAAVGGGRNRVDVAWSESSDDLVAALPTEAERDAAIADSAFAWRVGYVQEPAAPGASQATICAAIPAVAPDDKKLVKLVAALGGSVQLAPLSPVAVGGTPGTLIYGVISAKSAELAASTVRLKAKAAIVRIDAG